MAGAHLVDDQASGGVVRVVRLTLSFCWKFWRRSGWGEGIEGFQVIRQKGGEEGGGGGC